MCRLSLESKVHWPGNDASGVTIGRGYDLGSRSETDVFNDMSSSGVPDSIAKNISKGAGLKGNEADSFVRNNKTIIGEISRAAQYKLFNLVYPRYIKRANNNYVRWTNGKGPISWDLLDPKIRDVIVDFVYQGFTKSERPMVKSMNNNKAEIIEYIENNSTLKMYEAGRKRADYLRN